MLNEFCLADSLEEEAEVESSEEYYFEGGMLITFLSGIGYVIKKFLENSFQKETTQHKDHHEFVREILRKSPGRPSYHKDFVCGSNIRNLNDGMLLKTKEKILSQIEIFEGKKFKTKEELDLEFGFLSKEIKDLERKAKGDQSIMDLCIKLKKRIDRALFLKTAEEFHQTLHLYLLDDLEDHEKLIETRKKILSLSGLHEVDGEEDSSSYEDIILPPAVRINERRELYVETYEPVKPNKNLYSPSAKVKSLLL